MNVKIHKHCFVNDQVVGHPPISPVIFSLIYAIVNPWNNKFCLFIPVKSKYFPLDNGRTKGKNLKNQGFPKKQVLFGNTSLTAGGLLFYYLNCYFSGFWY